MTGRINCKAVISMALCMVMIAGILFPCNVHAASKYIGLVSENTCKKDDTAMYDVTNIRKAEQTISGKTSYSVKYGAKSFNLNCSTSGDGTLIYSSGNLNIAYVDYNGYVTVKGLGTTIITVTAPETDNYKAAYKMIKITVSKKKQTIGGHTVYDKTYGDPSFNLNCSTDGDGTLKYSSSNPNIVSVDANGDVVIKRSGKVTITVAASETSTYRSASKTININISKAAQTIKVREELAIIVEEGHYKLYNLGAVCDSGKVRYKSANTNIATVTSSGVVKANKWGGYTKIYVTALSDSKYKSASKTVKVRVYPHLGTPKLKCKNEYKKITFTWDKVPGAEEYEVWSYNKNKRKLMMIKNSSQRSVVIREPKIGKRYKVTVCARVKFVDGKKVYHYYGNDSNAVSVIGK